MSGTSKANQRQSKSHKGGYNKYRNEFRWEKNKIRKLLKHLKRFPGDTPIIAKIESLKKSIKAYG